MARRILTATLGPSLPALRVDERIDIQWKELFDDGGYWSDTVQFFDPTWELTRFGQKISPGESYGIVDNAEDRRWVLSALRRDDGSPTPPYIARVNEVGFGGQKKQNFIKIELLTGVDAESYSRAVNVGVQIKFLKSYWLLILVGFFVGYWWFF
ncbi:hypothetical protein ACFE33_01805 [Falsihalocynthiibacter sp. SS001]|uniref:hypothetical protein n=1 Tax=Falsihalocynthiibacter sp. SS001 TaxID=3349698 RepID=UPI0036D428B3